MSIEAKPATDVNILAKRQAWENSFRNPSYELTIDVQMAKEEFGIGILPKVTSFPKDINYKNLFAQTRNEGESDRCEVEFVNGGSAIWQDSGCESARNNPNVKTFNVVSETKKNNESEKSENTTGDSGSGGVSLPLIGGGALVIAGVALALRARREGPGHIENPSHNRNVSSSRRGLRIDYTETPYGPGGAEQDRFLAEQYEVSGRKARDREIAGRIVALKNFTKRYQKQCVHFAVTGGSNSRIEAQLKNASSMGRFIDNCDVKDLNGLERQANKMTDDLVKYDGGTQIKRNRTTWGEAWKNRLDDNEVDPKSPDRFKFL